MKNPLLGKIRFKVAGFLLAVFFIAASFAETTSFAGGHFGGTFDPNLGMTIVIHPEGSSSTVAAMNFGSLVEVPSGGGKVLRGNTGFAVFIYPQVSYIYQIYCTGTALTNSAGNTLPGGACVVTPVYASGDNGGAAMPAGSSVGNPGTWVTSAPRVIYNDTNGEYRAIQAHFAIREDISGATAAVPNSQPVGNYTGTVTFSVVYT